MSHQFTRSELRQTSDLDFEADAGDRLMRQLTAADAALARRIEPATRLAGRQLELLKPALVGIGARGLAFAPIANVAIGDFVFLLADAKRIVHCGCSLAAGCSAGQAIEQMVAVAEVIGRSECGWDKGAAGILFALLDHAGVEPGGTPTLGDVAVPLIGVMLAALVPETRARIGHAIDACREAAFCPVVSGLIGPSSSGRPGSHSLVWPLTMPLARYVEHELRQVDQAPSDA